MPFFVQETSRLFAWPALGSSGNFYVRALKLIADTEHGAGTGPAESVGARAGILKLEARTGSVGSSQTNFNFVFCVLAMPCNQDEVNMNDPMHLTETDWQWWGRPIRSGEQNDSDLENSDEPLFAMTERKWNGRES